MELKPIHDGDHYVCTWNAAMHGNSVIFKIQCVFVPTVINKKSACNLHGVFPHGLSRPNRQRHVRVKGKPCI